MSSDKLHPSFQPLSAIRELFTDVHIPWWIAGGWAIDLAVGKPSRDHHDIDVMVLERDEHALRSSLDGVEFRLIVGPGEYEQPWPLGQRLIAGPDRIRLISPQLPMPTEVICGAAVGRNWIYHRGRPGATTRALDKITQYRGQIPYLAPEVVLATKFLDNRDKDEADFNTAAPYLDPDQRQWLIQSMTQRWRSARRRAGDEASDGTDHPWIQHLLNMA